MSASIARKRTPMPGTGHRVLNVGVSYCNSIEKRPRAPVPAGHELLQKSHNLQQTDRLAQFKLVWVRGGRFCCAITGYQFLIEGVMQMTSKLAALLAGALSLGLVTAASAADM